MKDVLDPLPEKYPSLTPFFESEQCPGLYFLGALAHGRDRRKSSGGFVHGFRYLIRTTCRYLRATNHGVAWPREDVPLEGFAEHCLKRASETSSLFQCFGTLCDAYVWDGNRFRCFLDVPNAAPAAELIKKLAPDLSAGAGVVCAKLTFEYNRHWSNANAVRHGSALRPVHLEDPPSFSTRSEFLAWVDDEAISRVYRLAPGGGDVVVNELVHPVVRVYGASGELADVLHVDEELAVYFLYRKHRASRVFLANMVADAVAGRTNRALGHVKLAAGPKGVQVLCDEYE